MTKRECPSVKRKVYSSLAEVGDFLCDPLLPIPPHPTSVILRAPLSEPGPSSSVSYTKAQFRKVGLSLKVMKCLE